MTKVKSLVVLLAAISVFLLVAAWYFSNGAQKAEEARSGVSAQQALTRKEITKLKERAAASIESQRVVRTAAEKYDVPAGFSPPPAKPSARVIRGLSDMLRDDPIIQAKWLLAKHAEIRTTFNPFFQKQNLSPDQIRAFEENALKREEQVMDFQAAAQLQGLMPGDPAYGKALLQQQTEFEGNQRAVLGDTTFAQWQQYERTKYVQEMVSGFAGTSVLMGQPYTLQQAEDLVQALAKANPNYQRGRTADLASIDWAAADAQAQKILSPEQFALFTSTEPMGPSGSGARHQNQFWALVAKGRKQEAASGDGNRTASR